MNLFNEITRANAAYCAALGLPSAELYGTPPNEAEVEVHELIQAGVPAEAATPLARRLDEIGRMPKPARTFSARIEYARRSYVDRRSADEIAAGEARLSAAMAKDEARHAERFGSGSRNSWAGD